MRSTTSAEGGRIAVPGPAEVALDGAARELPVLDPDRLVQAHEVLVARVLLLAGVLGQEQGDRVTDDVEDGEGEDRDAEDDDDELDELADEVAPHRVTNGGREVSSRSPPAEPIDRRYFFRGVTRNIRSTSSGGAE